MLSASAPGTVSRGPVLGPCRPACWQQALPHSVASCAPVLYWGGSLRKLFPRKSCAFPESPLWSAPAPMLSKAALVGFKTAPQPSKLTAPSSKPSFLLQNLLSDNRHRFNVKKIVRRCFPIESDRTKEQFIRCGFLCVLLRNWGIKIVQLSEGAPEQAVQASGACSFHCAKRGREPAHSWRACSLIPLSVPVYFQTSDPQFNRQIHQYENTHLHTHPHTHP